MKILNCCLRKIKLSFEFFFNPDLTPSLCGPERVHYNLSKTLKCARI